jgi:hypothetical protein
VCLCFFCSEDLFEIQDYLNVNSNAYLYEIQAHLSEECGKLLSKQTIANNIKNVGITRKVGTKVCYFVAA